MPDAPLPEPLLQVDGLTAGYNRVPAVRDLSLRVGPGEVVALLGPNGAGKTTALLAMIGLVPLMSGSVTAFGRPIDGHPHRLARAGMLLVPDDRGVFFGLTVRDHFRLARKKADPARLAAVLERFPALAGLSGRKVGLLSGGEQQMLTIAKAVLAQPRILMIDEMSLGLAPKIVQQMLPAIRDLARDEGIGVVLVEQHIELALSVADRGIILNHGRVVLQDDAATLLRRRELVEAAYFGADEYGDVAAEVLPSGLAV